MKAVITALLLILSFITAPLAVAHDSEAQKGHEINKEQVIAKAYGDGDYTASFDAFPTLHPLVVHFPVVLLLLAAISQLVAFFVFRRELSWVTLALLVGGLLGAVVAMNFVHPHTTGLSERAHQVLEMHEKYAEYTLWLSVIALLAKGVSHFYFKRRLIAELVVVVIVIAAAVFVSMAGHYGSQLAYVEGIGAQGQYLEQH